MDELFTFVGSKNRVYVMTLVDRTTSYILGWAVTTERSEAIIQRMVDRAPKILEAFFATSSSRVSLPTRRSSSTMRACSWPFVLPFWNTWAAFSRKTDFHSDITC